MCVKHERSKIKYDDESGKKEFAWSIWEQTLEGEGTMFWVNFKWITSTDTGSYWNLQNSNLNDSGALVLFQIWNIGTAERRGEKNTQSEIWDGDSITYLPQYDAPTNIIL